MTAAFALREFRFWLTNYRRTWRGSIYSSVLNPVLYLGAMGLGLGTLVDEHHFGQPGRRQLPGVPGPRAAGRAAMQTAMGESTYPVLGSVKWLKTYQAAAATPLRPGDIFHGHLLFTTMRLTMNCCDLRRRDGRVRRRPLGLGDSRRCRSAVLTGLAFAAPDRGVRDQPDQGPVVRGAVPVRADPAVPVLRHVLPGQPAARVDQAARLRHAAVARGGAVPVAQPRHGHRRRRARPRRLPGGAGRRGLAAGHRTYRRRLYV